MEIIKKQRLCPRFSLLLKKTVGKTLTKKNDYTYHF